MSGTWDLRIIGGSSCVKLTEQICEILGVLPSQRVIATVKEETHVQVLESVRGMDVFIVQSGSTPVNDKIMEVILLIDACKRSSARSICVVLPYFAYGRQDKRQRDARHAIGAKLMANLIAVAGAHRVLVMEMSSGQVQGFFDIPLDHLQFNDVMVHYFEEHLIPTIAEEVTIVAAGKRATIRAKYIAEKLGCPIAVIDGRKGMPEENELIRRASFDGRDTEYYLLGDVAGRACIIVDEIIDHARTLSEAFEVLLEHGAERVFLGAVHAKFSEDGVQRLLDSGIEKIVCSDSLDTSRVGAVLGDRLHILSSAGLFAEAIRRIHFDEALEEYNVIDK